MNDKLKPSTRIRQIADGMSLFEDPSNRIMIIAILEYLDEQEEAKFLSKPL